MRVLSIDPGSKCLGWVLQEKHPHHGYQLKACGLSIREDSLSLGDLAYYHCAAIRLGMGGGEVDEVWIEQMQLTKAREPTLPKAIATGNDLLALQAIGAYIAGRLGGVLKYVTTTTWGGGLGQEVVRNRVERAFAGPEWDVFSAALTGKKTIDHNLIDAGGISLHATKRYNVGR